MTYSLVMLYSVGREVVIVGALTITPGVIVRVGRERGTVRVAGRDMEFYLEGGRVICKAELYVMTEDEAKP